MKRAWRVGRFPEDIWIVPRAVAALPVQAGEGRAEELSAGTAAWGSLDWFADDAPERSLLPEIHAALAGLSFAAPQADLALLRERVASALQSGLLRAYRVRETFAAASAPKEKEADKPPPPPKKAWIEFVFEYPNGKPVSGLDYTLVHPGGREEKGTLGEEGLISQEDVPPGTYSVVVKEVEQVTWVAPRSVKGAPRARVGEEAKLRARVSGYPDGASATIKIFREHREADAEVIDKLQGTVQGNLVEVAWKYDATASAERKKEEGIAAFIAEVSLDGGKRWGKTRAPLEVELQTLSVPRWSTAYAEDGDEVELLAGALGYADGTPVKLAVWEHDWDGDDKKVLDLPDAAVEGGEARAACTYALPDADGKGAGDLGEEGEYFFVVTIDAGARTARSGLLWCSDAGPG